MQTLPTLLLLIIGLTTSSQGLAVQKKPADTPASTPSAHSVMRCSGVTLNQAVEQVRRQYNGRIVSAETRRKGDCPIHVIKVLTEDGKVKTVTVPG
jgi:hypothetical protein